MVSIAVVDDDHEFTALVHTLLAERAWKVVACHESAGAVACVRQAQPNLVLLDLRMDAPDAGWRILQALTSDPTTSSIPVVVCSAAVDEVQAHEQWLRDRGIGILLKPFDIEELYAAVDQRLETSV